MNEIEKMIESLCPDGVEFRELREVCLPLKKATLKVSELLEDGKYPVINSGRNLYGYYNKYNNEGNAIIIAARGEYAGFINYIDTNFWAGGLCYPYRSIDEKILLTKFIYYILKVNEIGIMEKLVSRGSIPALNKSDLDLFKIPVPPLEIQEKIVKVLDIFTELEATLEAELSARKQQYEYYRNKLLTFDSITDRGGYESNPIWQRLAQLCPQGVPMVALGEVCKYAKNRIGAERLNSENYVGVDNLLPNKQGKKSSDYVPIEGNLIAYELGNILIGNIRPYLKKIWLADNYGGTNGDVLVFQLREEYKNKLLPKYLYYVLSSDLFFAYDTQHSKGAKMPRGDKTANMKYEFSLPPLEIQQMIVDILDKFDKLVNDLTAGLPAEINARRKQYEYYRERLLSFNEKI